MQGVANVGIRPTIGDLIKPILEVHLIDFDEDIYGQRIHVEFKSKIRDEKIFPSLNLMIKEIHRDIRHAKQYFSVQKSSFCKSNRLPAPARSFPSNMTLSRQHDPSPPT